MAADIDQALSPARDIARSCQRTFLASVVALGIVHPIASFASTYFVNTNGDPGPGGTLSLRQAIATANGSPNNTIQFTAALTGSTITLANGQIPISQPMTIVGPGAGALTISGNNASRIFYIRPVPDNSNPSSTPVTISGVTLTKGNAGGLSGGAILNFHSDLLLTHSTISASTAFFGGGIYSILAKVHVENSRLLGNQATYRGGGFYATANASVDIVYDTISGNSAAVQGGGVWIRGPGNALIKASTISGNALPQPDMNSGPQGGGGVAIADSTGSNIVTITNVTLTQNYAASGGAGLALLDASTANRTNVFFSTIAANSSAPYETGIGITSAAGQAALYNTIVANNFSQASSDDLAGSFYSGFSLIKSPGGATITGSGSLIGLDPQLEPLMDNGGPTFTMLPATTSPVIHHVPCFTCPTAEKDQRGQQRHDPTDIGAVERQYPEDLIFRDGFDPP